MQAPKKALRAGCDVDLLNQGACVGDDVCVGCDLPGANAVLPQQDNRFPNNELRCEGNRTCSQNVSSATFKFASPGQVMVCIGDVTCTDVWKVSNVGAACCSSAHDGDTCSNSSFNLTANDAFAKMMCAVMALGCAQILLWTTLKASFAEVFLPVPTHR